MICSSGIADQPMMSMHWSDIKDEYIIVEGHWNKSVSQTNNQATIQGLQYGPLSLYQIDITAVDMCYGNIGIHR